MEDLVMKKRVVSVFCLSLCLIFIISACGGGDSGTTDAGADTGAGTSDQSVSEPANTDTPADPTAETVEISVVHQSGYADYFDDLVIAQMAVEFPHIIVNATYNNEAYALIAQQMAAGAGPDIIQSGGTNMLMAYAKTGHVRVINDFADQYGWWDAFSDWTWRPVMLGDELYGLPGKLDTELVFYNKELFAEHGLSIPKNWDELISLCESIQALDILPIAFGSNDYKSANGWWGTLIVSSTVNPTKLESVLRGDVPWTSPEPTQAFEKFKYIFDQEFINNNYTAITIDSATQLFGTGLAAMKMEGTWILPNLTGDLAPQFDWGAFPMPPWSDDVEANIPTGLGVSFGINSKCEHPDAAAIYLDVYARRENQLEGINRSMGIPPIPNVDLSQVSGIAPQVVEIMDIINEFTAKDATSFLSWNYWGRLTEFYMEENVDALLLGQISLEDFMIGMQNAAEEDKAAGNLFDW